MIHKNPEIFNQFRTYFAFLALLALHFYADKALGQQSDPKNTRPNIVLIISDDQGWGDLSMHGNPYLSTPVLDKLAKEGAQFDRFYVSPLCAPTRSSLLTGRYHLRTGTAWVTGGLETMRSEETTLAEAFKAA